MDVQHETITTRHYCVAVYNNSGQSCFDKRLQADCEDTDQPVSLKIEP